MFKFRGTYKISSLSNCKWNHTSDFVRETLEEEEESHIRFCTRNTLNVQIQRNKETQMYNWRMYRSKGKLGWDPVHSSDKITKRKSSLSKLGPVTMAVRPVPSIPSVTSSAVEEEENPEGPFLLNNHIASIKERWNLKTQSGVIRICKSAWNFKLLLTNHRRPNHWIDMNHAFCHLFAHSPFVPKFTLYL